VKHRRLNGQSASDWSNGLPTPFLMTIPHMSAGALVLRLLVVEVQRNLY
jgi:hypothetical protein